MIKRRITGLVLSFILLISSCENIFADSKYNKKLIDGDTKQISMTLNKDVFKKSDDIVLINENALIDAISATPLAYKLDAPIITTKSKKLDTETIDYIKELGAKRVTIIGGSRNVSKTIERNLQNIGLETNRIYGEDRYETSLMIAKEMNNINKDISSLLIINKRTGLENALSIYSYAAKFNTPIVWSTDDDFKSIKKYIKKNSIKNIKIIKELNKSDTNIQMIKELQKGEIKELYTINAESNNIGCISLGVVAAKENMPILVTGEYLSYSQEKFIQKNNIKDLIQVGYETKDYSIINILISKNFISASILIVLILIIVFRAFKY